MKIRDFIDIIETKEYYQRQLEMLTLCECMCDAFRDTEELEQTRKLKEKLMKQYNKWLDQEV